MSREAVAKVLELLCASRAVVYHRLDGKPELSEERELLDRAHDLLLLEEGLRRYQDTLLGGDSGAAVPECEKESDAGSAACVDYGEWEHVGELSRLVRGGILTDVRGREIFVPEAVIRGEGIEHGDLVGARESGVNDRGGAVYYFQVLERRGGRACSRESFVSPLAQHGGEWGAYNEEEETFITVPLQDVDNLKLNEGDLVEIAYTAGDLSTARVAWYFDPEDELFAPPPQRRPQPRKEKRERATGDDAGGEESLPLDGVRVLVVGADAYKESFKRLFERMGASFTWESGFMVGRFLESKVNRADIVVIVTEAMKHKMPDVEAICERYGRPYVYSPSRGATGAVREVLHRLRQE